MAVTSRTLPAPTTPTEPTTTKRKRRASPLWPLGIVALAVGLILWPLGARYSLEGWIQALNVLLSLLRLPLAIPMPVGWWWLWFVPLGLVYSTVELLVRPGPPTSWHQAPQWTLATLLLIAVHASDIGSTIMGYLWPAEGAWTIHLWATTDGLWALGLWAVLVTYLPEQSIRYGLTWLGVELWND